MFGSAAFAQEAQWRGANRDGKFEGTDLLKEWPEQGPKKLFVVEGLGKGHSSAIASKDRIYTTGIKDSSEYLSCMDMTGKLLWQKSYGKCWQKSYPDARCTPTLDQGRIYVITAMDNLVCFDALNGDIIWQVDVHAEYATEWDMFGVSESVVVHGEHLLITTGGKETTVIALNKNDGTLVWKSKPLNTMKGNMAPVLIQHCGGEYLITATKTHLISVDANSGEIMWTYHYNHLNNGDNATILANTPLYKDSCLWVSNGWNEPSVMLRIANDGKSVTEVFRDHTFDNQNHGNILHDGYVYGSNFTGRNSGKWLCMNWKTGEILWIEDFHTKGPIMFADGMLYILDEKRGNIGLVEPSPKEFKLISSFRITDGKGPFWARPVVFNNMLLVRHGEALIAYDIKKAE
jgi:outer membrane protein assembly factor BamB